MVEPSGLWGPEPVQKVYTLDEDNEVKLKAAINEILAMAAKADIVIPVAMIEKFKELVK